MTACERGGNQRSICRMWFTDVDSFSEMFNVELSSALCQEECILAKNTK